MRSEFVPLASGRGVGAKVWFRPEPKADLVIATITESNRSGVVLVYNHWLDGVLEANCSRWLSKRESRLLPLAAEALR